MTRRPKFVGILNDAQLKEAWDLYKNHEVKAMREQLILHYRPLVVTVARRVGVNLPAHIDDEDLVSYGMFGLFDAIEKFDLTKGVQFATYASTRIHGAIIDELRSIDWVPRSVRSQVRGVNQAVQQLETELQRAPTEAEVADTMDITIAELRKARSQQNFVHIGALDALIDPDSESDYSLMNQLRDNRMQTPTASQELSDWRDRVSSATNLLPEREKLVIHLYYYEGLTLAEIGESLKVTESRVCQMHTRAMATIRSRLAPQ